MIDLLNRILHLVPGAKVNIWDCPINKYQGESIPIAINGFLVDWQPSNNLPCPTPQDLQNLDPVVIKESATNRNKMWRDQTAKKDQNIIRQFSIAKMINPQISLTQFLDTTEEELINQQNNIVESTIIKSKSNK